MVVSGQLAVRRRAASGAEQIDRLGRGAVVGDLGVLPDPSPGSEEAELLARQSVIVSARATDFSLLLTLRHNCRIASVQLRGFAIGAGSGMSAEAALP